MSLFDSVHYHLSPSLPASLINDLSYMLNKHGATLVPSIDDPTLTHLITNTNRFERWQDLSAREEDGSLAVVTVKWVERSVLLNKAQPTTYYSADPAMIFSGVVACAAELPTSDLEVLSAGITALGGQWRMGLTKDVTHLFAMNPTSPKYTTALHFKEHTHVKVLLPHWFDDAVRLGLGTLDTTPYEWPDPPLLQLTPPEADKDKGKNKENGKEEQAKKIIRKIDPEKRALYQSATLWEPDQPLPQTPSQLHVLGFASPTDGQTSADVAAATRNVWQGRKLLLSSSLELVGGRREAVEAGIKRAGGVVVRWDEDLDLKASKERELELVDECDVFVTRYRVGKAYVKAVRGAKTIGTLPWVFHVQSTGILTPPMDQLLWYPVPKKPIEGFTAHEITVTNYTGEAREYLKKLITAMGATFTPSMSGKNTVLIAAYIQGIKTTKAASWSIPIVNHTWLEDCFVRWRNLTVALEKYIVFPPGVDFSRMLGERGVGRAVEEISEEELENLEREDEDEDVLGKENNSVPDVPNDEIVPPMGTDASAKDAKEVEDVVAPMDIDISPLPKNHDEADAMDVDLVPASQNKPKRAREAEEDEERQNHNAEPDDDAVVMTPSPRKRATAADRSPAQSTPKKTLVSRMREKGESPAKTRIKKSKFKHHEDTNDDGEEEDANVEAQSSRGPTPDIHVRKRRNGRIEVTIGSPVLGKRASKIKANKDGGTESSRNSSSDEFEVIKVKTPVGASKRKGKEKEKEKEGGSEMRRKLAKRVGDQGDSSGEEGEDRNDGEREQQQRRRKEKTKMPARKDASSDEEQVSVVKQTKKTLKKKKVTVEEEKPLPAKAKVKSKKAIWVDDDEEEQSPESEEEVFKAVSGKKGSRPTPKSAIAKEKSRRGAKKSVSSDEDGDDSRTQVVQKAKMTAGGRLARKETPREGRTAKTRAAGKLPAAAELSSDTETYDGEDEGRISARPKRKGDTSASNVKNVDDVEPKTPLPTSTRTPKRVLSVLMPPLTLTSKVAPSKVGDKADTSLSSPLKRTESIRATAGEMGRSASTGRPSAPAVVISTSGSKATPASTSKAKRETPKAAHAQPSPANGAEISSAGGRSKRQAAAKATQKLRDTVMPDVMNFQAEMRKGVISVAGSDEGGSGRRKRVSDQRAEEGREARDKKKRKVSVGTSVKKVRLDDAEESDESEASRVVRKGDARPKGEEVAKKNISSSPVKSSVIKVMTTQVTLSEDVIKELAKLGVKMTTKPSECTHLLARSVVRTEKFLCALAVAPFILSEKWATESAAAKKLLDEMDYVLHDEAGERKYGFVLADSLEKAKARKDGLFARKTFYVTPKVAVDVRLLKNVVIACGGQVSTQVPTVRIISSNPDRHVVSCPDDSSIWRPIAQKFPVYTPELILTGVLKQEAEWENKTFRVPQSLDD